MQFETLKFEIQGHKAVVTLNRPDSMNSINRTASKELFEAFIEIKGNPDIWVAILTGAGEKAFSAGADLKESAESRKSGVSMLDHTNPLPPGGFLKNFLLWKPLIAAVNGFALGGGLELALACDIRVAADHARMGLPEVKWSLIAAAGGVTRLPRSIPRAVAMRMILTGEPITAQQALQWGLVTDVVPLKDLMPLAHNLADKICENAPLAVRAAKEASSKGLDLALESALAFEEDYVKRLISTEDFAEGPRAFAEKRKPIFKGR